MSIKDIIKSSVYDSFGAGVNLRFSSICLILCMACLIGAYIYFVYKNFSKAAFYSRDLNITLVGMTVTVAAILIAMQANLLVSLGMVGALSIVRFRTAVKNPLDLLYLFWAISEGIICGVGLYALGVLLCIIMTIALWVFGSIPNSQAPSVLIVTTDPELSTTAIDGLIRRNSRHTKQTSVTVKNGRREIIYLISTTKHRQLVDRISQIDGVISVNYLEHDGEMRG